MVEQLFTVRSERKANGKEQTEQLFTTRREKKGNEEADAALRKRFFTCL